MADRNELRTWSFLSLLVGGLLILLGGLAGALMMGAVSWMGAPMSEMMAPYVSAGWFTAIAWWMGIVSVLTGGIVLVAAYQVYRDRDPRLWGFVGVIAGALSLLAMGGWVLGAAGAILGGALSLASTERQAPRVPGA